VPRLSVIVVAKTRSADLPGCLESVRFADEIVVVDAESADRTRELAQAAGARVIVRPWPGHAAQKAFALAQATGDWCSRWTPTSAAPRSCGGHPRAGGRPRRGRLPGAVPHLGLRAAPALRGRWSERHLRCSGARSELLDRESTSAPRSRGTVGGPTRRSSTTAPARTLDELLEKVNRYSTLGALERFKRGKRFSRWSLLRGPWGFFKRYVLWLGVLDGWDGLVQAWLWATYDALKYAKLRDLQAGRGRALPS
jgi:hypothetical protein